MDMTYGLNEMKETFNESDSSFALQKRLSSLFQAFSPCLIRKISWLHCLELRFKCCNMRGLRKTQKSELSKDEWNHLMGRCLALGCRTLLGWLCLLSQGLCLSPSPARSSRFLPLLSARQQVQAQVLESLQTIGNTGIQVWLLALDWLALVVGSHLGCGQQMEDNSLSLSNKNKYKFENFKGNK